MGRFLYDMHIHTAETSKCGWMPGAFLAQLYKAAGYSGIVITDHFHEGYFSSLDCYNDWEKCVDHFLAGYRAAAEMGERLGLDVIMGAEVRFAENESDYLIYGIDEAFLKRNPYMYRLGHEAFFDRFGDEILIVHAHPYRNGNTVVFDDCVHGVEVINGNHRHRNHNDLALALCRREPRLICTCGSDTHRPGDECQCAMALDHRVSDSFGFMDALTRGEYRIEARIEKDILSACGGAAME